MRNVWFGMKKTVRPVCKGMAALVLFAFCMLLGPMQETWAWSGGIQRAEYEETSIEIDSRNAQVNQPFVAKNMFPGDRISQKYEVEVTHKGSILLHFRSSVRPGYEKLAEVLQAKAEIEGETAYEGLLAEMPDTIDYLIRPATSGAVVTTVDYCLTVYLDTSVGNEYQNQGLIADFEWWVLAEERDNTDSSTGSADDSGDSSDDSSDDGANDDGGSGSGGQSGQGSHPGGIVKPGEEDLIGELDGKLTYLPKTGDITGLLALTALISGLGFMVMLLLGKKRREEEDAR